MGRSNRPNQPKIKQAQYRRFMDAEVAASHEGMGDDMSLEGDKYRARRFSSGNRAASMFLDHPRQPGGVPTGAAETGISLIQLLKAMLEHKMMRRGDMKKSYLKGMENRRAMREPEDRGWTE